MLFEWDENKNRRNRVKHKDSFETAQLVFDDSNALSLKERVVDGEERWQTLGAVGGVVLLVGHTYEAMITDEFIRIITARKATSRERRIYEKQLDKTAD